MQELARPDQAVFFRHTVQKPELESSLSTLKLAKQLNLADERMSCEGPSQPHNLMNSSRQKWLQHCDAQERPLSCSRRRHHQTGHVPLLRQLCRCSGHNPQVGIQQVSAQRPVRRGSHLCRQILLNLHSNFGLQPLSWGVQHSHFWQAACLLPSGPAAAMLLQTCPRPQPEQRRLHPGATPADLVAHQSQAQA